MLTGNKDLLSLAGAHFSGKSIQQLAKQKKLTVQTLFKIHIQADSMHCENLIQQ